MHDTSDSMSREERSSNNEPIGELFAFAETSDKSLVDTPPSPSHIEDDPSFAQRRPLSILVVDDNDINRKVVGAILEKMGYQYLEAPSAHVALETVENAPIDYIFMDLDMPQMSGIEATSVIRERESTQTDRRPIEIIAVTANISPDTRLQCRRAGMNGFLEKPITSQMIKDQLLRSWSRIRPKST
jgi:CheY-like chemotaxis protein